MKNNKMLISVNSAKKKMIDSLKNYKNASEFIDFKDSENRVLANNIVSKNNIPEFDNSAVDGFAINYNSIKKGKKTLKIVGESRPGKPFKNKVKNGEAIVIFTGAFILKKNKVNTVCFEENCLIEDNNLKIIKLPEKGDNIRKKGEDIKKNQIAFKKGRKIRTVDLTQLSSLGLKKIKVFKKIKVGVFSSGDEISSSSKKKKFSIFDANKTVLISLIKRLGCEISDLGVIKDNFEHTQKKLNKNLSSFDLIITSGGVSKSRIDHIGNFFSTSGKVNFWQLSLKPGRPFAFGKLNNTPFIGLPGNPVAAVVTFLMLVVNFLKKLCGIKKTEIIERLIPANFEMKKKPGRTEWLRGSIKIINNNFFLEKFHTSGSGIISSISNTDGIIEINEDVKYIKKGTLLKFYRYEDILN
jgi:molybdopterin molybdotransferase